MTALKIRPLSFFSILLLATSVVGCEDEHYINESGMVWNTLYNITYSASKSLEDSIKATMRRVELSLSPFNESSLITRINKGETDSTDVLIDTVFAVSKKVNELSSGVFDPSAAPLFSLWNVGHGAKSNIDPTDQQIDSALTLVGIDSCFINNGLITRKSLGTQFNFSAITKGFGCDMVGETLRRNGCENYMVEIGGEIALSGFAPSGQLWRIQIDAPEFNDSTVTHTRLGVIELSNCGVATSGNYRNFRRDKNGRLYGHTISPVNGRPVTSVSTLSATIIAPDCMLADALATACMAMPLNDAMAMLESIDDVEGLLISAKDEGGYYFDTTSGFPQIKK
ncbi:MAG: FAD:protein FMN transferase [Muribaculaceae bacterium]|nr:FAD:protein FMN transferase [Muribaculaceae bacterium]